MRKSVKFDSNDTEEKEREKVHNWKLPISVQFGVVRLHTTYRKTILIEDFTQGRFHEYIRDDAAVNMQCHTALEAEAKIQDNTFELGRNLPEVFAVYEPRKARKQIAISLFLTALRDGSNHTSLRIPLIDSLQCIELNLHYDSLAIPAGKPLAHDGVYTIKSRREDNSADETAW